MKKEFFGLAPWSMLFALCLVVALLLAPSFSAEAQQLKKPYRIGVIHQGGPYQAVVDGLRDGLREFASDDRKQFLLDIRNAKGDSRLVEEAARTLEREKVSLIYAVTTSVATPVKNVTSQIPIVFCVGTDPVSTELVQSLVRPGGRLTGVEYSTTDLTGKRLEILKEILPKLSRVITIYNPNNAVAVEAADLARQAARQFGIKLVERHATSAEELRQAVGALNSKEADAYFYTSDGMVMSRAQLVIDMANAKRLPSMFSEQSLVAMGGLASYGQNFREIGRLSAKYVQKILTGTHPQDLPVERVNTFELTINLKTAKQIGVTIPPNLLARADKVIR
jgi:ABC-type uncharacterized transport system substrate-binding protein